MSKTTAVGAASSTAAGTALRDVLTLPQNPPRNADCYHRSSPCEPSCDVASLLLWIALLGAASGCIQRTLPLPPPSISAITVTACAPTECPQGGLIVTLEGSALPGAQVIVDDTALHASAPTGETLTVVTDASSTGAWRAVMGPVRVRGTMTVLAPRMGDALNVFQIQAAPSNEVSSSLTVTVGAPR